MANPGHREGQGVLVAAFGNKIEIVVGVDNIFGPASVGGISVEDGAGFVLIEDADSVCFRTIPHWGTRRDRSCTLLCFLPFPPV